MRRGVPIEVERGMVGRIASPLGAVMTGLVPATHAAPRVQARETKPQDLGPVGRLYLVGAGGGDKPGHDDAGDDGVDTSTEPRR